MIGLEGEGAVQIVLCQIRAGQGPIGRGPEDHRLDIAGRDIQRAIEIVEGGPVIASESLGDAAVDQQAGIVGREGQGGALGSDRRTRCACDQPELPGPAQQADAVQVSRGAAGRQNIGPGFQLGGSLARRHGIGRGGGLRREQKKRSGRCRQRNRTHPAISPHCCDIAEQDGPTVNRFQKSTLRT
jgi:hypothetical protein